MFLTEPESSKESIGWSATKADITMAINARIKSEYKATEYYENFVTHSEFRPYVTQVGLYDEQDRLLAHAKLSKPLKLDNQYDTSIVVRFDV